MIKKQNLKPFFKPKFMLFDPWASEPTIQFLCFLFQTQKINVIETFDNGQILSDTFFRHAAPNSSSELSLLYIGLA